LQVVETAETAAVDASFVHTSHCLATGQVMISYIGDKDGKPKGKRSYRCCATVGVSKAATRAWNSLAAARQDFAFVTSSGNSFHICDSEI